MPANEKADTSGNLALCREPSIKLFFSESDCCGCGACRTICPHNAIAMNQDEKGFYYPQIDRTRCTGCGVCRNVCPMERNVTQDEAASPKPNFYAVKHRSDEVRMQSSSGGMFTAISDWILEQGGSVYGAAFDADFQVRHMRTTTKAERNSFRGSKYVQSDLGSAFLQVKSDLASGIPVLFSGTPCQVAGLNLFLMRVKADTRSLYLCDLVCHGTPSTKLWQSHLVLLSSQYKSSIKSYLFRDKNGGWRDYHISVGFQNGSVVRDNRQVCSYSNLFSMDLALRPSCYRCPFANLHRPSDITIGDFWGIENSIPEFEDKKGISLVLTSTPKGHLLFQSVKNRLEVRPIRPEQGMQWNLQKPSAPSPKTDAFWSDYRAHGFEFVTKKYVPGGIRGKIKNGIKKVLLCVGLFDAAKRILHK